MAQQVVIHIGCPKTGTSWIQHQFVANPDELAAQGVLYPPSPDGFEQHFAASRALLGRPLKGAGPLGPNSWDDLVEVCQEWPGTAIISHEILASATPDRIELAAASFPDTGVQVVITARDLARQIPSEWQEHVKHRYTGTFSEFLSGLKDPDRTEGFAQWFWQVQDVAEIAARWAASFGAENVTIVTVPASRADATGLEARFGEAIGLDTSLLPRDDDRRNSSMGIAEAEVIRRLNETLDAETPERDYHDVVREFAVRRVLGPDRKSPALRLPESELDWVRERSQRWLDEIDAAGYRVIGDLQDLMPREADVSAASEVVDEQVVLDGAIRALGASLDAYTALRVQLHQELREERATVAELHHKLALAPPDSAKLHAKQAVVRRLENGRGGRGLLRIWRLRPGYVDPNA